MKLHEFCQYMQCKHFKDEEKKYNDKNHYYTCYSPKQGLVNPSEQAGFSTYCENSVRDCLDLKRYSKPTNIKYEYGACVHFDKLQVIIDLKDL